MHMGQRQRLDIKDLHSDNWHKQLPAHQDSRHAQLKAKASERKFKTQTAMGHLLIPKHVSR